MVELADVLDRLLQLLIIVEPAADLGDPLATHLAAHRTGGGMVAAMAGTVARFSQAREPRRDPWRTFRRAGFSGEQFALPDAIGMLREIRRQPDADTWLAVSGSDPLNLAGILTPGPKITSLAGNRVLYRDGVPTASLSVGEVTFFSELDPATEWQARQVLLRAPVRGTVTCSGEGCHN
jgi:hypothetical protein